MSWLWHWWLFFVAVIPCTIVVQFTRGAMNTMNVAKYGPRADYRAEPGSAIAGSVIAGAIYAAIVTALAGFLF
jgi:hypothetical protein